MIHNSFLVKRVQLSKALPSASFKPRDPINDPPKHRKNILRRELPDHPVRLREDLKKPLVVDPASHKTQPERHPTGEAGDVLRQLTRQIHLRSRRGRAGERAHESAQLLLSYVPERVGSFDGEKLEDAELADVFVVVPPLGEA